ncbi:MAG: hypothetical protein FJ090_22175 [Deltaproteobacteria bacterium]|nr:hypothetical protein [Deltaproteobacteria bacterium]
MTLTLLTAIFSLVGCPGDECDSGSCDTGAKDGDADTDTDTDTDTDADMSWTTTWSTDGVTLAITNGAGDYAFGMAETGSGEGWYGEDCIEGAGPNSGDFDICHGASASGVTLATVHAPADVVAGSTTLFNDTIASAGNITYVLGNDTDCWTTGNDTSYYTSALGCAVQ